jgi:hypothetical protein
MIKKGEWLLIVFNLAYIIAFTVYYVLIRNFEFLWYIVVMLVLFGLIAGTLRKTQLDSFVLWGISIWGLLHVMGGGVRVGGEVLYALPLVRIWELGGETILRYDQFVHFYLYVFVPIIAYQLLKGSLNSRASYGILYLVLALVGIGVGALNEVIEFAAVVVFPETGVGGYYNTALDLVFNSLGALLGTLVVHMRRKKG